MSGFVKCGRRECFNNLKGPDIRDEINYAILPMEDNAICIITTLLSSSTFCHSEKILIKILNVQGMRMFMISFSFEVS